MQLKVSFLERFVIDPTILYRDPGTGISDFSKLIHEVMDIIREDPSRIKSSLISRISHSKESQHKNPDVAISHMVNVAGISKQLTQILNEKVPELSLESPTVMYAMGLMHDFSKFYARYDQKFTQEDKELTLYFHARIVDVPIIAEKSAMHAGYFEILEMIYKSKGFSKVSMYGEWTKVLRDKAHPYNFYGIKSNFSKFLLCEDNLSLMVVTLADYLEKGSSSIKLDHLNLNFFQRTDDILQRYFYYPISIGKKPKALGEALVNQGAFKRAIKIKRVVSDLLHGDIEPYKNFSGLWRYD